MSVALRGSLQNLRRARVRRVPRLDRRLARSIDVAHHFFGRAIIASLGAPSRRGCARPDGSFVRAPVQGKSNHRRAARATDHSTATMSGVRPRSSRASRSPWGRDARGSASRASR